MVTGAVSGVSLLKSSLTSQEVTTDRFESSLSLPESFYLKAFSYPWSQSWHWVGGKCREVRMKNSNSWINISCSPFSGTILWCVLHRLWGNIAGSVSMVTAHQHTLPWLSSLPCLIPSLSHCASWDYMPKHYLHPTSHPTRTWGN